MNEVASLRRMEEENMEEHDIEVQMKERDMMIEDKNGVKEVIVDTDEEMDASNNVKKMVLRIWDGKKFVKYIIGSFAIAWVLQVIASVMSWKGNQIAFTMILAVSMYAPFAGTLLAGIPLRGMGWKPKFKGNIKNIVAAWFVPAIFTALGAVLYFVVFPNRLDFMGEYLRVAAGDASVEQLAAAGITPQMYLIIGLVQCLTYAPLVNMFAALGEEVGWRGAMQPMLNDRFGKRTGRIIGGVIWGAWHWPMMTLAGYEYGLNYWGYPILGMVVFCLFTIAVGTLEDALYEKSKCIWIPSLMHGSINAVATVPMMVGGSKYMDQMILGPIPMGLISIIPLLVMAIVVLVKEK